MGKDNQKGPDLLVPIPYVPEDEKEADPSDGKPPSVKLLLDSEGKKIDNPTVQAQPISNGGTNEQFFKRFQRLSSLLEGQTVGEYFRLALHFLRGTDKALWQREMDLASPKLAESAGLSLEASENLWYDSIMKITIHLLKYPRAGFKQVIYMEPFLWIGKNTGVRVFMDHLDILSTYLPLFPPMKGEVLKELSDDQKATILYDALTNYYIKKMKEANTEPIEMNLKELFQFTLNIEEAAINPGKDSEGNTRNSKEQRTETSIPRSKGKNHMKSGGKISIFKGQELPSCDFCGRKGHTETACRIKQKAMASAKKDTKDSSAQWKKDKAEKAQAFAAATASSKQDDSSSDEDDDDKDKKAFMKSCMASWKSSQQDKKAQKINTNVVIMILAILNKTIQRLSNL
jgi:hypothetical protein